MKGFTPLGQNHTKNGKLTLVGANAWPNTVKPADVVTSI